MTLKHCSDVKKFFFFAVCSIVSDLIFELFITLCIALNVIIMAMAYHGMSKSYERGLEYANYVSTKHVSENTKTIMYAPSTAQCM